MKRSDFFKGLFGITAVSLIPFKAIAKTVEEEKKYSFDEVFHQPYNNELLFYPKKDCELYLKIKKIIGTNRILDESKFSCYMPMHYTHIPIKEYYSISDFIPFILACNSYYNKNNHYSEYDNGTFFRMIRERGTNAMHFETFYVRPSFLLFNNLTIY